MSQSIFYQKIKEYLHKNFCSSFSVRQQTKKLYFLDFYNCSSKIGSMVFSDRNAAIRFANMLGY